jgi:hypothetical protein
LIVYVATVFLLNAKYVDPEGNGSERRLLLLGAITVIGVGIGAGSVELSMIDSREDNVVLDPGVILL